MKNTNKAGHLCALLTIIIWGTTFISTKVLLVDFQPVEILFFRFVMGFLMLLIIYPHRLTGTDRKQEVTFAAAGGCGICLYYLLENIVLTYTMASNVGVIISVAPFLTAILSHLFLKEEGKLQARFFIGFAVAIAGIFLISFNGSKLELNPVGDLLALLAALVWACYSILTKKISSYGYHTILTTRRVFFYGILFMIPTLFLFDFHLQLERFTNPVYLFNIVFLGIGALALCFVSWNFAVKILGAVKTSIYIYMVPVITVVTSALILHEPLTVVSVIGTILLSVIFFGKLNGVREGTIIAALLVGFIARLFGKHLEFVKPYIFPEDYKTDEKQRAGAENESENDGEIQEDTRHRNVIVIGRQYGSGGHEIGQILANKLGFDFYDQKIIEMAAGTTGMTPEFIEKREETMTNSLLYDLVNQMYQYRDEKEEAPKTTLK